MFEFGGPVDPDDSRVLNSGQRVRVDARLENPLAPGRYFVHCGVHRQGPGGANIVMYTENACDFVVYGSASRGVLSLEHEIEFVVDGEERSR